MLRKVMNVMTATAIIGSGVVGGVIAPLSTTQAQASVMHELDSKWTSYKFLNANGGAVSEGGATLNNSLIKLTQSNGYSYGRVLVNSKNNLEAGKEYEISYSTKATTTVAKHSVDARVSLGTLSAGGRILSSGAKFKMTAGSLIMLDVATKNSAGTITNYNFDVEISGLTIQKTQAQLEKDALEEANSDKVAQDNAREAVNNLFENKNPQGLITADVTQESIDKAKELVDKVMDPTIKAELEAYITEAQKQVDAKTAETAAEEARQEVATNAVKELFNNNDVTGTIKESTNQEAIDNAKELVATITDAGKKAELEAQIVEAQKQLTDRVTGTGNTFTLKQDRYLTGNYTGNATAMSVDVNGKRYYGGKVKDGAFSFYALDKIAKETDEIIVNLHGVDKSIKTTFSVTVKSLKKDAATTSATFTMGEKNIVGTVTGDIKTFGVTIDGTLYYGGTISPDGTFKFYAYDKKIKVDSVVTIVGYDASRTNVLSEGNVEILK